MNVDPKNVITWLLILVVPIVAVVLIAGALSLAQPGLILSIIENHFAATIGLPMAALLAAFIVVALRHSEGPIKLEGIGMKFEGTSGQVVLRVVCFLSIAVAIKLLWELHSYIKTEI